MIKHIWFDMAGTLYFENERFVLEHDALRFRKYAEITHKPNDDTTAREYMELYNKLGSNSAVFRSFGEASDYWQQAFEDMDLSSLLSPDQNVIDTLKKLKAIVPISLFTNFKTQKIKKTLNLLDIPEDYFTHILSGDDISERKPNPEGFHKMIELSHLPAESILYVGDRIDVDIKPAKAVGMKACLLWEKSDEADYFAASFSDIPQAIQAEILPA